MTSEQPYYRQAVRQPAAGVHPFMVRMPDGAVSGPYPSYDIALLAARQSEAESLMQSLADDPPSGYAEYRQHARAWFGSRVRAWLQAGMPDRGRLPDDTALAAIEPRILARNGTAVAVYLASSPRTPPQPLYDRIAARYLWAAHNMRVPPAAVRQVLEPLHESYALRRLWQNRRCSRVVATANPGQPARRCLGLQADEAVRRLRLHALLYRGLGRHWLLRLEGGEDYAKWLRFCRRSVLLPGMSAAALYRQARTLVSAAAIDHGIDAGEESLTLRQTLLHLAQWRLATRAGMLAW